VIRLEFGLSYHPVHVGRLLKALGWSPQKGLVNLLRVHMIMRQEPTWLPPVMNLRRR
jgi:transposase